MLLITGLLQAVLVAAQVHTVRQGLQQLELQARIKEASAATVQRIHHIRTTIVDKGKEVARKEELLQKQAAADRKKKAERLVWHEAIIEAIELKGEINLQCVVG